MKRYLVGLWHYLEALISEVVLVFGGLLGVVYFLVSVYVPDFPQLEPFVLPLYFLGLFAIASFRVWLNERMAKEALEGKLDNPVDYEISATVKRINFDFVRDDYLVTEKDREHAQHLIAQWDEWEARLSPEMFAEFKGRGTLPSKEEGIAYLEALEHYSRAVTEFDEKVQNCYLIDLFIKNTGHTFDERITVNIDGATHEDSAFRLYRSIDDLYPLPEKPTLGDTGTVGLAAKMVRSIVWGARDEKPNPEKWRSYSVSSASMSIIIADLPAGAGTSLTHGEHVLQSEADSLTLKYWVVTRHAKAPIEKVLPIDLKGAEALFKYAQE